MAAGDEHCCKPRRVLCGLVVRQASLLTVFNRLAVAPPRAKTTEHLAGFLLLAATEDRRPKFAANQVGLRTQPTPDWTQVDRITPP